MRFSHVPVVSGAGRGRKLGVPTINFDPKIAKNISKGIYVCKVLAPINSWGVLHYGSRPTFGEKEKTLEVHLLDFTFEEEIPSHLDIEIFDYIRKILNFKTPQKMVLQIEDDISRARNIIRRLEIGD